MLYYATLSATHAEDEAIRDFLRIGANEHQITLDSSAIFKKPGSKFQCLKEHLIETGESLTVDSLRSFGKTNREIAKELQWFKAAAVPLFVLDVPSTFRKTASAIDVLTECYNNLAATEVQRVKAEQRAGIDRSKAQNKPFGRPRIAYPDNWSAVYAQWASNEITIAEFMQLTGLKKGTLYNLIKQYKEQKSVLAQDA